VKTGPSTRPATAFGDAFSDTEIAAVANYVTAGFGSASSKLTDKDIAELRRQAQ